MKINRIAALSALALAATFGTAQAQDWSGFYAGLYAGQAYNGSENMAGALAGYNFQTGIYVIGAEVDWFQTDAGKNEAFANLRAGVVLGDKFLLFGKVGRGQFIGSLDLNSVGIGAEFAVTPSISIRADYEKHNTLGSDVFSGPSFTKIGAVWNF